MGCVRAVTMSVGLLSLVCLASCGRIAEAQREAKAKKCAQAYFEENLDAASEAASEPREKTYRVFGRLGNDDMPTGRSDEAEKVSEDAAVYDVVIPFCYVRETDDGDTANRRAEFRARVEVPEDDADASVVSHSVAKDRPLTTGHQLRGWLRSAAAIFAILWVITIGWKDSPWVAIAGLAAIVCVGVVSYYCFNSWVAVPIGVVVFVVLGGLVGGLLTGIWFVLTRGRG